MRLIEQALRREARQQLLVSVILLCTGLGLSFWGFNKSVLVSVLGLGVLVMGSQLVYKTIRQLRLQLHPLHILLHYQPQRVVWVYSVVTQWMPFGLKFGQLSLVYFYTLDGKHYTISLPSAKIKLLSKYLNRLLPHATFGYSNHKEAVFRTQPAELIRKKMP
jgi:hypothetical protein